MNHVADSIRRGLEEAVAYARGEAKERDYRVHGPVTRASHDGPARKSEQSDPATGGAR